MVNSVLLCVMTDKNRHTTYLDQYTSEKLIRDAKTQKRSVSNMIELIVNKYYYDKPISAADKQFITGPK